MTTAIVEIPKDCYLKYEVDKETGILCVDRVLPLALPANYGYIPNTLAPDNDPLDVFIVSKYQIQPLSRVRIHIYGVFKAVDNGDQDDKLIASISGENIQDWNTELSRIKYYLENYKTGFTIQSFEGASVATDLFYGLQLS